jgi:hypothetical protein
LVQLGTAGELATQLFGVLPVIGELVVVIVPPRRKMPPAPPLPLLELTGLLVRVVAVELITAIPPPCAWELMLDLTGVLVVVSVPLRPL